MKPHELASVLKTAWAPWPTREITEHTLRAFALALNSFELAETMKAVGAVLRERERSFPPTATEIRDAILRERKRALEQERHEALMTAEQTPAEQFIEKQKREAREKYPWLFE